MAVIMQKTVKKKCCDDSCVACLSWAVKGMRRQPNEASEPKNDSEAEEPGNPDALAVKKASMKETSDAERGNECGDASIEPPLRKPLLRRVCDACFGEEDPDDGPPRVENYRYPNRGDAGKGGDAAEIVEEPLSILELDQCGRRGVVTRPNTPLGTKMARDGRYFVVFDAPSDEVTAAEAPGKLAK